MLPPIADTASELAICSLLKGGGTGSLERVLTMGLTAEAFTLPDVRLFFLAIQTLYLSGVSITNLAIRTKLQEMGSSPDSIKFALLPAGDEEKSDLVFYGRRVLDCALARKALELVDGFSSKTRDNPLRVRGEIASLTGRLIGIASQGQEEDPHPSAILAEAALEPDEGIKLGLPRWDAVTGGLIPSRLHTVLAPTSHGKSLLACAFSVATILASKPVVYCSTEMVGSEILARMIANLGLISIEEIKKGMGYDEEREQRRQGTFNLVNDLVRVYCRVRSAAEMAQRLRWHQAEFGQVGLFVVDHLHKITGAHESGDFGKYRKENTFYRDIMSIFHDVVLKEKVAGLVLGQVPVDLTRMVLAKGDVDFLRAKEAGDVVDITDYAYLLARNTERPNHSVLLMKKDRFKGAEHRFDLEVDPVHYRIREAL